MKDKNIASAEERDVLIAAGNLRSFGTTLEGGHIVLITVDFRPLESNKVGPLRALGCK